MTKDDKPSKRTRRPNGFGRKGLAAMRDTCREQARNAPNLALTVKFSDLAAQFDAMIARPARARAS